LIHQTSKNFEYNIIDGGSTDGNKEYIESVKEYLNYWVSEPDNGIYYAMNKGIEVAKGVYCLFLNSGDVLHNENDFYTFMEISIEDIIYGNVKIKNKE